MSAADTKLRRSGEVARRLSASIRDGELPVGSFLPPSRALASRFGVSLNTVQIALRELETQNLIECLPRRGSVVRGAVPGSGAAPPPVERPVQALQVGVIGPDFYNATLDAWTTRILHAAEEKLFASHYRLSLLPGANSPDLPAQVAARLDSLPASLAGVICFWDERLRLVLDELDARSLPWVCINRPDEQFANNFVVADNQSATRLLGGAFVASGYERVQVIAHSFGYLSSVKKVAGLYQGYLEMGAPTSGINYVTCEGDGDEMTGYRLLKEQLEGHPPPQVVFATGDDLALGAMHALREAGLGIPEQVGVVGATGLRRAEQASPSLSVVAQPMEEMGQATAEMLLDMIGRGERRVPGRKIPCPLLVRDSLRLDQWPKGDGRSC